MIINNNIKTPVFFMFVFILMRALSQKDTQHGGLVLDGSGEFFMKWSCLKWGILVELTKPVRKFVILKGLSITISTL